MGDVRSSNMVSSTNAAESIVYFLKSLLSRPQLVGFLLTTLRRTLLSKAKRVEVRLVTLRDVGTEFQTLSLDGKALSGMFLKM